MTQTHDRRIWGAFSGANKKYNLLYFSIPYGSEVYRNGYTGIPRAKLRLPHHVSSKQFFQQFKSSVYRRYTSGIPAIENMKQELVYRMNTAGIPRLQNE